MKNQIKKLLFLGGSDTQIPGIKYAKSLGYHVITCDYLPDNPGHKVSDKYYDISTTDLEGVLEIAQREKIDGITAYASDPAALTASYVAEKMGLPGNLFESTLILSNKDSFRKFMKEKGYKHPNFANVANVDEVKNFITKYGKSIIKPVDSSGSKGICIVDGESDIDAIFEEAKKYTRNGRVLVEKFIKRKGRQICGDVVVVEGQMIFAGHGNVHFDDVCDPVTPCSITLPANNGEILISNLNKTLQNIFTDLNITCGTFNVDAIVDEDDNIYVVEIGARNGGNLFTELIKMQSGFDIVRVTLKGAIEELKISEVVDSDEYNTTPKKNYYAHYVVHSKIDGVLDKIEFTDEIEDNIEYKNIKVNKGDTINKFNGSNDRLGLCLLGFNNYDEMIDKVENFHNYVKIKIKK